MPWGREGVQPKRHIKKLYEIAMTSFREYEGEDRGSKVPGFVGTIWMVPYLSMDIRNDVFLLE